MILIGNYRTIRLLTFLIQSITRFFTIGGPERIAKALLSLLSVVAAVTLALRSQHARRVEERNLELEERRAERKEELEFKRQLKLKGLEEKLPKVSEKDSERSASFGKYRDWRHVPEDDRLKIFQMRSDVRLVMAEYGVSKRTGYNWIGNAEEELIGKLEGAVEAA